MIPRNAKDIDWSLYAIVDKAWLRGRDIAELAEAIIAGGATVIQHRDKVSESGAFYTDAKALRQVTLERGIPLIINDRADIALAVDADGVHVGQQDLPVEAVCRLIGPDRLLGGSVHDAMEFEQVIQADHFGVGAVFPTQTKSAKVSGLDMIRKIRNLTDKPIVGIGGITVDNLAGVFEAGADGVAVISDILGADDAQSATRQFKDAILKIKK